MRWLPGYRRRWLARDLLAGVTAAAVVIPQAMACARIAGLPVQFGLYVAFVPTLAYAVLGTSRALSVSTTSTISILTATAIAGVVEPAGRGDRRRDPCGRHRLHPVRRRTAQARVARRLHLAAHPDRLQDRHRPRPHRQPARQAVGHTGRGRQLLRQ